MTRPIFWYWLVPVFVPMGAKGDANSPPIAPFSVPIQGVHLVRKPYTLLIYQGVWGLYLLFSKVVALIASDTETGETTRVAPQPERPGKC
jgi:hypothetical protein